MKMNLFSRASPGQPTTLFLGRSVFFHTLCVLSEVFPIPPQRSRPVCWPSACLAPLTSNLAVASPSPPVPWTRSLALLWCFHIGSCRHVDTSRLGARTKMCSRHLSLYLRISNSVKLNYKMIVKPFFLSLRDWANGVKDSHLASRMSLISCQCCWTWSDICCRVCSLAEALGDDGGQPSFLRVSYFASENCGRGEDRSSHVANKTSGERLISRYWFLWMARS